MEKMKETRHAQMLATQQGSPMANPESLKDKASGKCLICRQAGHWAKECPNHDKSPKMACYKCHWLGHQTAVCLHDPSASRSSVKPSLTMVQQDWSSPLQPTRLSQITITGLEPRVHLDAAGRSENFFLDTGAAYSVLTSYSRAFSPQTCTILGATGKLTIFTSHPVKQLLNGRGHLWMSNQRILRCQVVLMENPGLAISPCEVLNPATLLPTPEGSLPFHSCLETSDHWTKSQEGLLKDPLTSPEEMWYTDGSRFVLDR